MRWANIAIGVALSGGVLPSVAAATEALSAAAAARAQLYESGEIHRALVAAKEATWARKTGLGLMDSSIYQSYAEGAAPVPCVNGEAAVIPGDRNNTFKCNNIDFYDFVSHAKLGSATGQGSSSWGWTSPDGREFAIIAQADGAAFAEVTKDGRLSYLGRLPQYTGARPAIWREMRGYKSYIIIGSEAEGHGIQIFDLQKLVDIDPSKPVTFTQRDLTGHFKGLPIGRTHNVVVNEEKNYAVAVGAQPRNSACASGLIFIDLKDPSKPTSPGCAAGDGYVHDAQCLVYHGPDTKYEGRDICYGYNEDTLTIYDVTDKTTAKIISRTTYSGAQYTHQGWVTNTTWQEFLVLDDEYDEVNRTGPGAQGKPVTYFWDIRSLEKPRQTGFFRSAVTGIDHNQFVVGKYAFQSNYASGLRVLDISSIPRDPTGGGVREAAFFDIYPEDDDLPGGGEIDFAGSWSSYPFFKSGFIIVNTIERGAFVVKMTNRE